MSRATDGDPILPTWQQMDVEPQLLTPRLFVACNKVGHKVGNWSMEYSLNKVGRRVDDICVAA